MNAQEEARLIQALWSKGSVSVLDRLLFRNFFHVSNRAPEDQPAYLRREPSIHLAVVSCSDCQVDVNNIFQLRPGEAIMLQNGGNVSNPDLIRSLIVAVYELGVTNIVVLGHVNCTYKGLNVDHLEMKTNHAANITAGSFGFSDPKVFYRPIDDVLDNTLQQARILRTHPLFRQRVIILAMLYDDATGFVYNADALQASRTKVVPVKEVPAASPATSGPTQIVIRSDTPKQIQAEIEKLINKFPGNTVFVLKVLRNWQWDKYVEEHTKGTYARKATTQTTTLSLPELLKNAAEEKLALLTKVENLSPLMLGAAPARESLNPRLRLEGGNQEINREDFESARQRAAENAKAIAATIHNASQAIPNQLVAPIPRVVVPKIHVPRARIPRFHFVAEFPEEETEPKPEDQPEEASQSDEEYEQEEDTDSAEDLDSEEEDESQ